MSLVHKHYKYDKFFKALDSRVQPRPEFEDNVLITDQNTSRSNTTPYGLPVLSPRSGYYIGKLNNITTPTNNVDATETTTLNSFFNNSKSKRDMQASSIHPATPSDSKPAPLRIPKLTIRKFDHTDFPNSNPLKSAKSKVSSPMTFDSSSNIKSARFRDTIAAKNDSRISNYLSYLNQTEKSISEDRWEQRFRDSQRHNKIKVPKDDQLSALEMNAKIIEPLLMVEPTESARMSPYFTKDLTIEHRKPSKQKTSIIIEAPTLTSVTSFKELKSEEAPIRSKHLTLRTSTRLVSMLSPKRRAKRATIVSDNRLLYREIASNLHELYTHCLNEKRIANIVAVLASQNTQVIKLVLAKYHRVENYDPARLEQKFAMIEFIPEGASIPLRSQKKEIFNVVDISVLGHLQVFSQKLEEYNIKKRNETLLAVKSNLDETRQKVSEYRQKRIKNLASKGDVKRYCAKEALEKDLMDIPTYNPGQMDTTEAVRMYQRNNIDFKFIQNKNLEYALCLNSVFNDLAKEGV